MRCLIISDTTTHSKYWYYKYVQLYWGAPPLLAPPPPRFLRLWVQGKSVTENRHYPNENQISCLNDTYSDKKMCNQSNYLMENRHYPNANQALETQSEINNPMCYTKPIRDE